MLNIPTFTESDFKAILQQQAKMPKVPMQQTLSTIGAALQIITMDQIRPQSVHWLWPDRIALGKLTLLMGDPGTGKSILTIGMAAHVSRGRDWPDGTACPHGDVMIISAEDDPADTIRPRLDAAGADATRIHCINGVVSKKKQKGFQITEENLTLLDEALTRAEQVRLVIIDPISAYLGGTDSHINAEVREVLAPLAELAAKHGVAVLAVTHMNKTGGANAIYRAMGSLAFVAAARAAFVVAKDKDDPSRRLFLPVKNNLAPDKGGLAFCIDQGGSSAPVVTWAQGTVTMTADDALQSLRMPQPVRPTAQRQAETWLRDQMAGGRAPAEEITTKAEQAGIAKSTLQRAKDALGIRSQRVGDCWYYVPGSEQPASGACH